MKYHHHNVTTVIYISDITTSPLGIFEISLDYVHHFIVAIGTVNVVSWNLDRGEVYNIM
jgi:hypothetical protein